MLSEVFFRISDDENISVVIERSGERFKMQNKLKCSIRFPRAAPSLLITAP